MVIEQRQFEINAKTKFNASLKGLNSDHKLQELLTLKMPFGKVGEKKGRAFDEFTPANKLFSSPSNAGPKVSSVDTESDTAAS